MPIHEYGEVHQNSIFDLAWLRESSKVVTASGDMQSVLFDLEAGQEVMKLSKVHEASVKAVTQVESHSNLVLTGCREGKIALHDLR